MATLPGNIYIFLKLVKLREHNLRKINYEQIFQIFQVRALGQIKKNVKALSKIWP
jgi:hypothetical protein